MVLPAVIPSQSAHAAQCSKARAGRCSVERPHAGYAAFIFVLLILKVYVSHKMGLMFVVLAIIATSNYKLVPNKVIAVICQHEEDIQRGKKHKQSDDQTFGNVLKNPENPLYPLPLGVF